jgi:hypothetical protein
MSLYINNILFLFYFTITFQYKKKEPGTKQFDEERIQHK